ncbi:Alpha/Beta hydrolase protein [Mariannaea sp. PMI_226]|nr:Alpha/Beta hydrolase protein [Mariannaea sp. PMI_226]
MKRCTAVFAGRLPIARSGIQTRSRRCISYAKPTLTQEALLEQIESQLGDDLDGKPMRIDPDAKTVNTAAGSLPISPIMDPAWIKSKRRPRKNDPGKISGQFRKKLSNNPFAEALMTPIRRCMNTDTLLPRYFLQDMEVVSHPDRPEEHWITPGPFSLDSVIPVYTSGPWSPTGQAHTNPKNRPESYANPPTISSDAINTDSKADGLDGSLQVERRRQSPVTNYCLSRLSLVEALSEKAGKSARSSRYRMFGSRSGMVTSTYNIHDAIWRPDMGEMILRQQRRAVVDALIYRATRSKDPDFRFLQSVNNWDEVKNIEKRGSVLWFADRVDPVADSFATLDIQHAKWWKKMPVHNLTWLLGGDEVHRLRESSEIFRNNDIVVLKLWRSESMRKLHLLLWRMQVFVSMEKNPEIIQPEEWAQPTAGGRAVPVFLIHDGGGTTFAYHCLEPLGRSVYGIHNPNFHNQEIFEGGIPEMGRLYTKFIKEAIAEPDFPARHNQDGGVDILLGGWSMGGLLSLEIARLLAEDLTVRVIGIVMCDSVYPFQDPPKPAQAPAASAEEGKTKNQILSMRAMTAARQMITTWALPVWDGHLYGRRPKISLVRATEVIPNEDGANTSIDVYRSQRNLGWDRYEENMFTEIVDVEGHHFNMFDFEYIPDVTEAVKQCLDSLDSVWVASS